MNVLDIAILIFIIMESMNVLVLYFMPQTKIGNGVGVFNGFENSKSDEPVHMLVRYLVNWVAGVKLIFILLLCVILALGSDHIKIYAMITMLISIATYFWRLHPIVKKLDNMGEISPKGYSKVLGAMILGFLVMFAGAIFLYF